MSTEEKNELKRSSYTEAMRYIDNAKDALHKAKREGKKVYHLNIGQPDIETPHEVFEAMKVFTKNLTLLQK